MADDVATLQALEALIARSAERYEAAAAGAVDPRLVTPFNDRAAERRRAAAALAETAHSLGGHVEVSGGGGLFDRIAETLRGAVASADDGVTLETLAAREDELDRAFSEALADRELGTPARAEIDAISGSLADARQELGRLIAAREMPGGADGR